MCACICWGGGGEGRMEGKTTSLPVFHHGHEDYVVYIRITLYTYNNYNINNKLTHDWPRKKN